MRHTITKEDEGKIIYAIPTGNNARSYEKDDGPISFLVKKVKRKYVDLSQVYHDGSYGRIMPFHPTTGATQQMIAAGYGGNAGYMFFKTKDDVSRHWLESGMRRDISDFFARRSFELDFDDMATIHNIIMGDK